MVLATAKYDGLLHLSLDVPDNAVLTTWAATPYKPLAGHITFFETDAQSARETVSFEAGQCIGYHESFRAGDAGAGAYVCQLVIAAEKLTLKAGGADRKLVPAPVRDHKTAVVAGAVGGAGATKSEYTSDEFRKTIWDADQVAPEVIDKLYTHFTAATASANPTPHWAAMEDLIRATTYVDA